MKAYLPLGLLFAPSTFPASHQLQHPTVSVAAAFVFSPQTARATVATGKPIRYAPIPPSAGGGSRHFAARRTMGTEVEQADDTIDADMLLMGDGFVENLTRQQHEFKQLNKEEAYLHHELLPTSEAGLIGTQNQTTHLKSENREGGGVVVVAPASPFAAAASSRRRQQQRMNLLKSVVASIVLSTSACTAALTLRRFDEFIHAADLAGTAVFAFGGAVTAGQKGMDLLGMIMVATIVAIGGGTTRDLLLGVSNPAFWIRIPAFLKTCVATAVLTFAFWPALERKFGWKDSANIICVSDAFGLAAFAVVGTQKAIDMGLTPFMWVVSGLISCTFGGIIRDVLCQQKPRVMHPERTLYATPAVLGSMAYTALVHNFRAKRQIAATVCFVVTFVTRVASFHNPMRLPHWNVSGNEGAEQKRET